MFKLTTLLLIVTATSTALMAGLFYAWSCSVTIGIARLPDSAYLAAMQVMNRAILNGFFLSVFMGTLVLLPVCTYMHYQQPSSVAFWCLLIATFAYAVGVFCVTMVGNVPMNDALDVFNIQTASAEQLATQRLRFEGPWNSLNLLRAISGTIAVIFVIIACIFSNKAE